MNPRLLEIIARKKEIAGLVERAANLDELKKLKNELGALAEEEETLITRAQIAEGLKNGGGAPVNVPGNVPEALNKYDSLEYRNAFMNFVLSNGQNKIPAEYRNAETTATTDIGAVIPNTIIQRVVDKLQAFGMILNEVTQTALQGGVTYPVSTVKPVATWVNEDKGSDTIKKTVQSVTFAYHKLRCAVALTLAADSTSLAVFEQTIVQNIAEAMIVGLEKGIINGSGSNQPKGVITENVAAERIVKVKKALTYKDVIAAEAALPQAYEPNAKWVMNKKTFMGFVGQVDTDGQPIAKVNYGTSGAPERYILGRQVICCDYLEALTDKTAENTVVAFLFDLKNYAVNTNYNMGIKKYMDEATDNQVLKSVMLADGKCIDTNGLVLIKSDKTV